MPDVFRDKLIQSVHADGREGYRAAMENIGIVEGRMGEITNLRIRVIKGIQRLKLGSAMLTTEGLATRDGAIIDCSAALVQQKRGKWSRYSGKDSPHPTRIFSDYNYDTRQFFIWSEIENDYAEKPKEFDVGILAPREGEIIPVTFGNAGILEGVLEAGPLTEHIRQCLAAFEDEVERIGILLRHPTFHRHSNTRTPGVDGIDTLFSDGAEHHVMNRRTVDERMNPDILRTMVMDNFRPGIEIAGEEMPPNIEDIISQIRVHTKSHEDILLNFTDLTPRCLVTQRGVFTGKINKEPKSWLRKNQPIRPWDNLVTIGVNADMATEYAGSIISVGDRFTVTGERTQWRQ